MIKKEFSNEDAQKELNKKQDAAKDVLNDEEKGEKFLNKLASKLTKQNVLSAIDSVVDYAKLMAKLVKSYIKKEYKNIPTATIISIVAALVYLVSPVDAIPDILPAIGLTDDVAVIALCLRAAKHDLDIYKEWLKTSKEAIDNEEK